MSSLNVHDINGISTYGNEVRIPSGSNLNVVGEIDAATVDVSTRLDLPVWTNATRPSNPATGTVGYNDDANDTKRMEFYNGTEWVAIDKTQIMGLPVTSGLQAWMDGDTWSSSNNRWEDKSGNNNHSSNTVGTVTKATWNGGDGATGTFPYIYGNTNAGVRITNGWNNNNDYTFFHVTRYNGGSRNRIWQGLSGNWLSAHWAGRRGVFYHNGWLNSGNQGTTTDWIQATDSRQLCRYNRGTGRYTGGGNFSPNGVAINNAGSGGCCNANERSDWATAEIILYNRTLSESEMILIENYLYNKYKVG